MGNATFDENFVSQNQKTSEGDLYAFLLDLGLLRPSGTLCFVYGD